MAYAPFATKLRAATVLLLFVTLLTARASFSNPPTPAAAEGTVPTATATPISASALTPTPEPTVPTAPQGEDDAPAQSGGLFSQIEGDPPPSTDVETLAGRLVGIDFGQLAQVTKPTISPKRRAASKPQTLVLNLFDDVVFTGMVEHIEPTASGHALWGTLDGVELGTMTLVVNGSVVVGTVRTPDAVYSIRTAGDGTYVIRQIDESSLPPLEEPLEVTLPSRDASAEVDDFPPDDGSEIDVMVVYTPLAKHREGSRAAIEALIELFVAETNQAYANSGVIHRMRLVLREEVDYLETGDSGIDLNRLRIASDGYMDHIHELRDLYAADLVHIVVGVSDKCGQASGLGFNESQGFALTAHYCGALTFAHELGHNMHLEHDRFGLLREYPGTELGSEANYGYVNQRMFEPGAPASARWRTIMAYPTQCVRVGGCRRILYFSNPDNTFSGDPMGVPADHPSTGVDGPADAVGTLNKRREITANFRPSSTSPTPRVGLALSQYWLSETGGHATVTATLHRLSRADTIVTVSASSVDAVALSSNRTLTIPAGQKVSVGTVTITGVDNDDQTGDVSVNVSATVANTSGQGVITPRPVVLVIVDNETTPKVTLSLSPEEIYEIEGSLGQTLVTATLDNRSSERATVTVSASPNEAVLVNWPTQLTIPAGQTASDRFVVIEAVRDFEFTGSKKGVMVSGDASSSLGITGPESVKLTIIDTDAPIFWRDSVAYTFKAGVAASRPLPRAAFGNGLLTYSMTPDPSNGVTFSPGPPARIGASSTSARDGEAIYTLTATDAEGDTDTMKVSIAVAEGVCPDSTAVLGYRNMGIDTDCEALLESKDILRGDRSLNWRMHRSVGKWQGVSIVDDRVVEMDMSYLRLSGAIPTELGNLSSLESLDLSNNNLTGAVPSEMINLSNLEHLYLKGNRLSGCVPAGLRNVPHNDLDAVRLPICAGPTTPTIPQPPKVGQVIPRTATGLLIVEWRAPLSDGGSDIIAYDMRYIETSSDKAVDSNWKEVQNVWTVGGGAFSYQLAGLTNDTEYDLQVRAVNLEGDGPWSMPVTGTPLTPSACVTEGAVADAKTTGLVSDCEILLEARDTLSGSATLNWTVDTPIAHWNGVRLDERLRRVTVLDLRQLGLGGSLPSEISGLTALEWLALHDNDLTGPIPRELGSLPKLRRLWLSGNRLTGKIPAELGNLTNLNHLILNSNQLTGEIPAELGQLTNLQGLYLGQNRLTGQIPRELGNLAKLRDLYLDANQLTGETPGELGNLTNLERLFLYSNQLTGEIPAELGNLNNLEWLYLNNNQLTQEIPAELGNLTNLDYLILSSNKLTGEIPAELGNLHYLKRLHLDTNQLSGTIPAELGNLSNLEKLFLQYNQLTGAIPAELGSLAKLEQLILRGNLLSSCIPAGMQDVPSNDFSQLNLPHCEVTIPRAPRISQVITGTGTGLLIVKWDEPLRDGGSNFTAYDLRYIEASSDEVVDSNWKVVSDVWSTGSGTLNYQLTGLTEGIPYDLQVRAVSAAGDGPWSPPFTGTPEPVSVCIVDGAVADGSNTGLVSDCETLLEIRDTLDESATLNWAANTPITEWDGVRFRGMPERVSELRLSLNRFSGKIPHEVGNLTSLRGLHLGGNRLTGEIPKELGNLTNLEVLDLSPNQLFGEIPPELGNLANLQWLSLNGNRLNGEIPPELGNLVSLQGLNLNVNRLAGEIPSELGNLSYLRSLDLSRNQLTGEIVPELGNLADLQWLSLNGNQLTGKIPVELGYLGNLQRLYLSDNSVNGCIPAELQDAPDHDLGSLGLPYCEVTTPLAPSISQVIHSTRTSILVVGWDAPSRDGGSDITTYDLRYIETSADETVDSNWTVVRDVWTKSKGPLRYALTGLAAETQYDLQLRAVNGVGDGPWSATATGTTTSGSDCTTGIAVPDAANNPGLVSDCEALLETKPDLVGSGTLNWAADIAMTQWEGVRLSGTPGRVTRLTLDQKGLSGTIPALLGSLSMLTELNLRTNQLTGPIPTELGRLANLTTLSLSGNQLTGGIPADLGNLSNLQELYLSQNQLTGEIPTELGSLANLTTLSLSGNQLTGGIPADLGNLSNLQELYLSQNQLTGEIPTELGSLANLTTLSLSGNQLTGGIPADLGNLSNLQELYLSSNQLTGEIPTELSSLANLVALYLSNNQLSGCIPEGLRDVADNDLEDLDLPFCDVLLSGLTISPGSTTPPFNPYHTDYAVVVGQSQVTVTPTIDHNSTLHFLDQNRVEVADADGSLDGYQVDLGLGVTTISISVISQDGRATLTYTIQVSRAARPVAPVISIITPGRGSLSVSWTAPRETGGANITSYDLRHIESRAPDKADANWFLVNDAWTGGLLSYTITGLTGSTQYDVQVRAVNVVGYGPWSNQASDTVPVNELPVFTEGAKATRLVAENSAEATNIGMPIAASDADDDTLTYTLGGSDAALFAIDSGTGQIRVGDSTTLDYETKTSYSVDVSAADPYGATAMITLIITVTNIDEEGTVTLSTMEPQVGVELTATLDDPDGTVSGATWQWARSSDGSTWADITEATDTAYTPVAADEGNYLRATASYTDGEGSGKSAQGISDNLVTAEDPLLNRYDANKNGLIDRDEVLQAVVDYFNNIITRDEVLGVIALYFSS